MSRECPPRTRQPRGKIIRLLRRLLIGATWSEPFLATVVPSQANLREARVSHRANSSGDVALLLPTRRSPECCGLGVGYNLVTMRRDPPRRT